MVEKTATDLTTTFTDPLPSDLYLSAHSATSGPGRVSPNELPAGAGGSGPPLATVAPLPHGTIAVIGVSSEAARADHVHIRSNATQVAFTPAGNIAATTVATALTELDTEKLAVTARAAANGVASLDASTLIPIAQIPQLAATKTNVAATGNVTAGDLQATVAALDSRISSLTQSLTLAGTYDAATNLVDAIAGSGLVDGVLPVAAAGNNNKYLIVTVTGTGIGNAAGLGTLEQGNWLYSNGTAWIELVLNSGTTAASNVSFTPGGVIAATNVQAALAELGVEKVGTSTIVTGEHSITGGGALTANATLSLSGDVASPGNNQVYGTNAAGNRGWKPDPAGGGGAVNIPFTIRSSSLPLLTPANRTYLSGDVTNGVQYPVYEFSGSADTRIDMFGNVPSTYANGSILVRLPFAMSGNAGSVTWGVSFIRLSSTFVLTASTTFTFFSVTVAVPTTTMATGIAQITLTQANANNIAAGDPFIMRVRRLGSDSSTSLAYLDHWAVSVVEI